MSSQSQLDEEFVERSKEIQRNSGRTFYLATLMFPERIRHETYVLYAFFRKADEVVDTTDPEPNQEERLEEFRKVALGEEETDDPVLEAFNIVRTQRGIRDEDVTAFIDAMKMDTEKSRYEDFSELREYMDGSAAAVGRMMTSIIGPENEQKALPHATSLGEAYQMTNFLRDVEEDINQYGRIYLPQSTLNEYNVDEESIVENEEMRGLQSAIKHEIDRTEELYWDGVSGIKHLPKDCQFAILVSAVLYVQHHKVIEDNGYKTFDVDHNLSTSGKLLLTAKTYYYWKKYRSPEKVFEIVSCIGEDTTSSLFGRFKATAANVKSHVPIIG